MRRLNSLLIFCCIVTVADVAAAAPIYRWRDATGMLHFSNRPEATPKDATEVTLPPIAEAGPVPRVSTSAAAAARTTTTPRATRAASRGRIARACAVPDARGVADAITARLGARAVDGLTLIVGGIPVAYSADARVSISGPDAEPQAAALTAQAAIAYPAGSPCPARPPLERYAVVTGGRAPSRRLCDDYRRALAEVGVAVNRDQGVASSFRDVAEEFTEVATRHYTAGGRTATGTLTMLTYTPEERVPLPPWVVEAHVAQARELAAESSDLVDELTVALEEIDAAARRAGCW